MKRLIRFITYTFISVLMGCGFKPINTNHYPSFVLSSNTPETYQLEKEIKVLYPSIETKHASFNIVLKSSSFSETQTALTSSTTTALNVLRYTLQFDLYHKNNKPILVNQSITTRTALYLDKNEMLGSNARRLEMQKILKLRAIRQLLLRLQHIHKVG